MKVIERTFIDKLLLIKNESKLLWCTPLQATGYVCALTLVIMIS